MKRLVDYSSSSAASDVPEEESFDQPSKRRRIEETRPDLDDPESDPEPQYRGRSYLDVPALPSAFHDLYASNVRLSVTDDPSLHDGRRRQTPHVRGRWPTHVYIEWHPTANQHSELSKLVKAVRRQFHIYPPIHDFLSSDLGAPLPLHISLSRPLSLSTAQKDHFSDDVKAAIRKCNLAPFKVRPVATEWHKSLDSDRSFLVLRMASRIVDGPLALQNPELLALLERCNRVATTYKQPTLYKEGSQERPDRAFHVSIAWTLGLAKEEPDEGNAHDLLRTDEHRAITTWDIDVSAIKVKVGNIIDSVDIGRVPPAKISLFEF